MPYTNIAKHRIFQFRELLELQIVNSNFKNHQNVIIFELYGVHESDLYDEINVTMITFDSITVVNNMAYIYDPSDIFSTLFNINNHLLPTQATFKNSVFNNNKIGILSLYLYHSQLF